MAKTSVRSAVLGSIAALMLFISACAGDDETPPGLYSEPCDDTTTCASGLMCVAALGICTQLCTTETECRTNLGESQTVCSGGVCQEPCLPTDFNGCPPGLSCIAASSGSTCRAR